MTEKNLGGLCTIIPIWGKYRYKRLSVGFSKSPYTFQKSINETSDEFYFACVYIYVLVFLWVVGLIAWKK